MAAILYEFENNEVDTYIIGQTQILYQYAPIRTPSHKEIRNYVLHQLDSRAINSQISIFLHEQRQGK